MSGRCSSECRSSTQRTILVSCLGLCRSASRATEPQIPPPILLLSASFGMLLIEGILEIRQSPRTQLHEVSSHRVVRNWPGIACPSAPAMQALLNSVDQRARDWCDKIPVAESCTEQPLPLLVGCILTLLPVCGSGASANQALATLD